nr:immunoglobulin light chain junction region [Macaca mulatta]MOW41426.1 immunoglobulin light chain junction region [Macaca mulatta]MOW41906.1 immunoglobulin light chain junction region [Macaca mulatta]
CLQFESYPRTF